MIRQFRQVDVFGDGPCTGNRSLAIQRSAPPGPGWTLAACLQLRALWFRNATQGWFPFASRKNNLRSQRRHC
ncbi:hypothetical protein [Cryobacterium sp. TMT1-66-1]|uniref:hypothetical protein n=1 Tax=unclassified Cryobacterium TaxID=2649013 RepID=UPI00351A79A6